MNASHRTLHPEGAVDPVRDLGLPMRFMAVGLGVLALLSLAYPSHLDLLRGSFYDPHLLTFVHLNTLGLIGAVVFGASYQMLPIVLQTPLAGLRPVPMLEQLYSRPLALAGFACRTSGLVLGALVPLTTAEWLPLGAATGLSLGGAATIANGLRVARHWLGRSA